MAATRLPDLTVPDRPRVDVEGLEQALRDRVDGEVRFDAGSRGAYSTDASNYREVPIGVVVPATIDAGAEVVRVCAEFGAPVLSRGGGTSLGGQCTNTAVVIDWSKHCRRIESIDPETRTAIVEPGVVLDQLDAAASEHGLQFGPKPSTHPHCVLGGMIGNNACGSAAQAYGKTVDGVRRLEIVTADGERMWVGRDADAFDDIVAAGGRQAELYRGLRELVDEFGDDIRAGFPDIPRRVSGYNLDDLLPERGFDVARALVGSESTLVTVLRAELVLVPVVAERAFVVLGFDGIEEAADAVPAVLDHDPLILEALDQRLIDHERERRTTAEGLEDLPPGDAWLVIQLGGDTEDEIEERTRTLVDAFSAGDEPPAITVLRDPVEQAAIMEVREGALGATAWIEGEHSTWPGWEDAAVPPARLGEYLREFRALLEEFGYGTASLYGHFGQGCVHTRIPFELATLRGVADYRRFIERAAHLVTSYGGSLSGEHGDGQARGALLPIMYGPRVMAAFRRFKRLFDPEDRMNPGKLIDARPPQDDLKLGPDYAPPPVEHQHFSYPEDRGTFDNAALRCVGVGKCRNHTGAVMCPSYRATGDEEHSTRGRARLLFEMLNATPGDGSIEDGWRSTEVRDALDLCLACKGCRSDCPVNVDMATYKAEFLSHHYEGRMRPMSHYSMGWLPFWAQVVERVPFAPPIVNRLARVPWIGKTVAKLGGLEPDRPIPTFANEPFHSSYRRRGSRGSALRGEVLLWPDTFTDNLHPGVAAAAVEVLEDAGYRVVIPDQALCCGLTWISTGQLDTAAHVLRRTAEALRPWLERGVPVVGLEPSCTAVFRTDGPELLPTDDAVQLLRERTRTLAELLDETEGWHPPKVDVDAVVQPHCHAHAVLGFDSERALMAAAGIRAHEVEGCCGLAGNFGFEDGHLDVSVACAETALLPAVREAGDDAVVLADGFSCRTQVEQTGGARRPVHLAELLAAGIRGAELGARAEERIARRPGPIAEIPLERRGVQPFVAQDAGP